MRELRSVLAGAMLRRRWTAAKQPQRMSSVTSGPEKPAGRLHLPSRRARAAASRRASAEFPPFLRRSLTLYGRSWRAQFLLQTEKVRSREAGFPFPNHSRSFPAVAGIPQTSAKGTSPKIDFTAVLDRRRQLFRRGVIQKASTCAKKNPYKS